MWQEWDTGEVHIGFWWGDLRERDHVEHIVVYGRVILKMDLQEVWGHGLE
jgi:hypothetical protein